jgi:hypothetical protein
MKNLVAVGEAFGDNIDFAQLVNLYGKEGNGSMRLSHPQLVAHDRKIYLQHLA